MTRHRKIFTLKEAAVLLPAVQETTAKAVKEVSVLAAQMIALREGEAERRGFYQSEQSKIITKWAQEINELGAEVKGLWLVDFDNGDGYYCWQYPEETISFFHGYTEGLGGRTRIKQPRSG